MKSDSVETEMMDYTTNENQVAEIQRKLQDHTVIYVGREQGFKLSGIPLGGELFINAALQGNLDKTLHAIAKIGKLKNTQEKLVLLLQCIPGRIQHLLAAVPMNLSRDFARQHDEAIMNAVSEVLLPQGTNSSCSGRFPTTDWAFAVWRPTWSFCF